MTWLSADALVPESYAQLLPACSTVVHSLGTLFEDTGYKSAIKSGDALGLVGKAFNSMTGANIGGSRSNPLEDSSKSPITSYERINRDSGKIFHPMMRAALNSCVPQPCASVRLLSPQKLLILKPRRIMHLYTFRQRTYSDPSFHLATYQRNEKLSVAFETYCTGNRICGRHLFGPVSTRSAPTIN